jgi:hypothetical protein
MNATVSPDLFHFTGIDHKRRVYKPDSVALETLFLILQSSKFLLAMNKREFRLLRTPSAPTGIKYDFTLPMACFTETPFEFLKQHTEKFGEFGLGLTLEWAMKNAAQNVVYCDPLIPNSYLMAIYDVTNPLFKDSDKSKEPVYPFDGPQHPINEFIAASEDMGYRDEREWRIIGRLEKGKVVGPGHVPFTPDDVTHIFCPQHLIGELTKKLKDANCFDGLPGITATEDLP